MASNVVAIIGENANCILDVQSQRFLALLPAGLTGHVLRLSDPEFPARLDALLRDGICFAWGYAGVGARLEVRGRNLWDALAVPFISVLADAPFIMPANHHVPSPWVVNGYIYREWLEVQRAYFQAPQVSALLPMGVIPNPDARVTPWSRRTRRMVFVKGGADPAAQRARWIGWPSSLRHVLHDAADALAAQGTGPILPTVQACLAAHGLSLDGRKQLLFGLLHELDTYIRSLRATVIARALLPLGADIVGGGWDHLPPGRARMLPAMDASRLEALYADTQILVNVSPNFGSGAHERVLRGFAARACVASDNNDHARAHLHALPSFHGFDWHAPELGDHLAALFDDPSPYDDKVDEAQAWVERHHSPAAFLDGMAALADLVRMQGVMSPYALDAA
ncbi:MAG: hypothetical protein ACRYHQ_12725 [Janthinobacterium lividum]